MIFQLLILASSLFSPLAQSQSKIDGVMIRNADVMNSDSVKKVITMKGNVQIAFQQQSLSADSATINWGDQSIEATGNVILETMKVHIEAKRLKFYYRTNVGMIYEGFVQSGQVVFEGDQIEKTGPDNYLATNARFTTCDTCPAGWSFSGKQIEAEMGGYAFIKRPVFKVVGVPIFIFPGMVVPLKSTRQSGFLIPGLERGGLGGIAVTQPFFWAIDRSRDLTLTPKYYENRGLKAHASYRYVMSEQSKGSLDSAIITDRVLKNLYLLPNPVTRYFIHYQHHFELPDDYVHRMDVKPVSDLRYNRDFPNELKGWGDPALENKMSVTKNMEAHHFSAEAALYTNQLKYYPLADNTDAVHRMPEIRYSKREERIGTWGPLIRWDFSYVNFARDRYSYDTLEADPDRPWFMRGKIDAQGNLIRDPFNPANDILRTGQRMDFSPTVSYPFQVANRFDIIPSLMFRETQYQFDLPADAESAGYSPTAARRYVQADIAARTEFTSIFGDLQTEKADRYKHSVEPEVFFSQIPWIRNPNHPFFGNPAGIPFSRQMEPISDADVNGKNKLQFDYNDRVFDKNLLGLALTNKFVRKTYVNGDPVYKRLALFRVSQSYDFTQVTQGSRQPWSSVDSLLSLRLERLETLTAATYNPYANIGNVSAMLRGKLDDKNYLLFTYNHNYLIDEKNRVQPGSETENYGAGLGYTSRYFDMEGTVDYNRLLPYSRRIQAFNYSVILRPPGNCWYLKFNHRQEIGGETIVNFNFAMDFSGAKAGTPSNLGPQI